jgi:hypothetical protein
LDEVRIRSSPVPSIAQFLSARQIRPDVEAAALLFDMNPQVALRGGFSENDRIRFIRPQADPEIAKALSDGFLYKVHYDQRLRTSLLQLGEAIQHSRGAASRSPAAKESLGCISSAADDLEEVLNHVKDRDHPLNHAVLSQLEGDADILGSFLARIATPGTAASPEDRKSVCLLASDLKVKREHFSGTRDATSDTLVPWPMVKVVVNTKDATTGSLVKLLTVHYVAVALQKSAYRIHEFAQLSSPSEQLLPEADYLFWATKGQDPTLLGPRELQVRDTGSPVSIDLAIKK